MSLSFLRKKNHPEAGQDPAPAAVQAAAPAADLAEPRGRHHAGSPARDGQRAPALLSPAGAAALLAPGARPSPAVSFEGASGIGLMPASRAPSGDDTIVFRVPASSGVPGYTIPPGTPWMTHPDGALPYRSPGAAVPPASVPVLRTEPADPELLRDLRDALKALPDGPATRIAAPPHPVAWLRAVQPEGLPHLDVALAGRPRFIRAGQLSEVHLGETDEGPFRIAADRAWLKAAGLAFLQAADAEPSSDVTRTDVPAVPAAGGAL